MRTFKLGTDGCGTGVAGAHESKREGQASMPRHNLPPCLTTPWYGIRFDATITTGRTKTNCMRNGYRNVDNSTLQVLLGIFR